MAPPPTRGRLGWEIAIVLGLSLGQSAVYSIVNLVNLLTREKPLGEQTVTVNPSRDPREIFDLIYQLLANGFALMPVLLVCFLLWRPAPPRLGRLGIDGAHPVRDSLHGLGLALAIGLPGIGLYLAGRALGVGVVVNASGLDAHWWTVPVLLLSAARAGIQEEVIMLGYLSARLGELRWSRWGIILSSALLRGTYHLYQGFGAFVANALMGALFGWIYARTGRVIPFVVAHFAIDAVVFVGHPVAAATWPELFGVPGREAVDS